VATFLIGLMLDSDNPHPLLDTMFQILCFPADYFPIFNALFWGFGLTSLIFLLCRYFFFKRGSRNVTTPKSSLP
jgi:hypothetical protein